MLAFGGIGTGQSQRVNVHSSRLRLHRTVVHDVQGFFLASSPSSSHSSLDVIYTSTAHQWSSPATLAIQQPALRAAAMSGPGS